MTNITPINAEAEAALKARIAELEAKLAAANAPKALTMKVSDKGGLSIYGLGRFPVTLYASQWERLLAAGPQIGTFIKAHANLLARKEV